ncbi:MAG TPA: UDP-N-acetylglucosamine 2-epimerase (non-hydrolyzing) [Acidimicrobiales bacterium]|nr:UDP-N-acetylglucosamine 2-epimerase (non-hydrolyzing) [Acidimicrobiales bacterium]
MTFPARVAVVIGTRPEAVKLAPVIWALDTHPDLTPVVISTGQHRELLTPTLGDLGIVPDHYLDTMSAGGDLAALTARLIAALGPLWEDIHPDAVVVQGDTTSAMTAALTAFYAHLPVAHVEAGLRSGSLDDPFPEELNRKTIAVAARWHFAPTPLASERLRSEGVSPDNIDMVGNTVIDTLSWAWHKRLGTSAFGLTRRPRLRMLVTLHRRETQGAPMAALAAGIAEIAGTSDLEIVLPLHKSPAVRASLVPALSGYPHIRLCEPLGYLDFLATLSQADLLLTDSGGALEEAAGLGIPTLVCREATERSEAIDAGTARLVGTEPRHVVTETVALLADPAARAAMSEAPCPFGDGNTATRIVARLAQSLASSSSRPLLSATTS